MTAIGRSDVDLDEAVSHASSDQLRRWIGQPHRCVSQVVGLYDVLIVCAPIYLITIADGLHHTISAHLNLWNFAARLPVVFDLV
jgi:hypothetical protein